MQRHIVANVPRGHLFAPFLQVVKHLRCHCQGILKKLLQRVIAGELTEDAALEQFGAWSKGEIQARIARGVPPPNAASTVKRKGSSTPLIDTGILRSSIDYEVRK